jgi:hypothetical protein
VAIRQPVHVKRSFDPSSIKVVCANACTSRTSCETFEWGWFLLGRFSHASPVASLLNCTSVTYGQHTRQYLKLGLAHAW